MEGEGGYFTSIFDGDASEGCVTSVGGGDALIGGTEIGIGVGKGRRATEAYNRRGLSFTIAFILFLKEILFFEENII